MLKKRLYEKAKALGIDLIATASAEPFAAEGDILASRPPVPFVPHEAATRIDPAAVLPGVQSIIAAGISYYVPDDDGAEPAPVALTGRLSRYCRGLDYHDLLTRLLQQLAEWLEEQVPGSRTAVCVDTGPPLDRAAAARAGLGWFGKNCSIIADGVGSYVFLGELLTTVALAPDPPVDPRCGSCRICLDACPTGAFVDAYHLDPARCISTLTQQKGFIDRELRPLMGDHIFGCDVCAEVCPHNKLIPETRHADYFRPRSGVGARPSLAQMMQMTNAEFRQWFRPTAAGWRGRTVLQRNAVIALGNSGDPEAVPLLLQALADKRPVIRGHAAWALGHLLPALRQRGQAAGIEDAVAAALAERLRTEADAAVRTELTHALAACRNEAAQQEDSPPRRE